jgi:hypothetical protein
MSTTLFPFPQPVSIGQVLDAALLLFRRSLLRCLPLSLLTVVVGQLPTAWALQQGILSGAASPKDTTWWALTIAGGVVNLALWGAIMLRQRSIAYGGDSTFARDMGAAAARLPALLAAAILAALLTVLGFVLLIVPGIYIAGALIVAFPVLLLEGVGPVAAIRRSLRLVRRHWWRATTIAGVASVLGLVVIGAVVLVAGFFVMQFLGSVDLATSLVITSVGTALISGLFTPFATALAHAQYADLVVRVDGADLAQRIGKLAPA